MESELLINYIYNVDEKPLRAGHVIWISGNFPLPDFLFEEIIHHFIKKRRKIILIVMKKSPKLHNYWFFFFFSREVIKSTLQQQQLYQHVHPVSGQWALFSFLFNMLVRKKKTSLKCCPWCWTDWALQPWAHECSHMSNTSGHLPSTSGKKCRRARSSVS